MRIAVATCARHPGLIDGDQLLTRALEHRGAEVLPVLWTDRTAKWHRFDRCVVRAPWDYPDHPEQFQQWLVDIEHQTEVVNPAPLLRWNMHKGHLRELALKGVPCIPTVWLPARHPADLATILDEQGWPEVVCKPAVSGGARHTRPIRRGDAEGQTWLDDRLAEADMMVQPRIQGIAEEGENLLIFIDGQFSHAARRRARPGQFLNHELLGGEVFAADATPEERELAQRCLAALDPVPAIARVDLIRYRGAAHLLELELIDPLLYFEFRPEAAEALAEAVVRDPQRTNVC